LASFTIPNVADKTVNISTSALEEDDDIADIKQKAQFYRDYVSLGESDANELKQQLESAFLANKTIYQKLVEESAQLQMKKLQQLTAQYDAMRHSLKSKRDELIRASVERKSQVKKSTSVFLTEQQPIEEPTVHIRASIDADKIKEQINSIL